MKDGEKGAVRCRVKGRHPTSLKQHRESSASGANNVEVKLDIHIAPCVRRTRT